MCSSTGFRGFSPFARRQKLWSPTRTSASFARERATFRRVGFEKSVIVAPASRGCSVFVDEPAENFASVDAQRRRTESGGQARLRRLERKRATWPVPVEVVDVVPEYAVEVASVEDQDAVEAVATERPDPTLGVSVRVRRPNRRADDPHALAAKHRVEVEAELAVAVMEQEPERLFRVAELHHQVAGLLLDPAALERHEEQHIDPCQRDCLDGQEVACEHRRCLLAQEPPPAQTVSHWGGRQPVPDQDRPHRAWRDRNAKAEQLTDDPLVPPARVLPREPDDELLDFVAYRRASDPTARIRPAARDQPLVPTQQRPRTHQEH